MNQVCLSVLTRPRCTQCGGKPKNKSESHQTLSVWICTAKERERGKSILSDIREAPPSSSVRCCGTSKEKRDIILFFFYLFDSANDSEWMEPRWEMAGCGRCISCRRSRHWMSGTRKRRYDTVFFLSVCVSLFFKNIEIVLLYLFPLLANKHSCTENCSEFKLDAKFEKYTYSRFCQGDSLQCCQSEQVLDELSASQVVRKEILIITCIHSVLPRANTRN